MRFRPPPPANRAASASAATFSPHIVAALAGLLVASPLQSAIADVPYSAPTPTLLAAILSCDDSGKCFEKYTDAGELTDRGRQSINDLAAARAKAKAEAEAAVQKEIEARAQAEADWAQARAEAEAKKVEQAAAERAKKEADTVAYKQAQKEMARSIFSMPKIGSPEAERRRRRHAC